MTKENKFFDLLYKEKNEKGASVIEAMGIAQHWQDPNLQKNFNLFADVGGRVNDSSPNSASLKNLYNKTLNESLNFLAEKSKIIYTNFEHDREKLSKFMDSDDNSSTPIEIDELALNLVGAYEKQLLSFKDSSDTPIPNSQYPNAMAGPSGSSFDLSQLNLKTIESPFLFKVPGFYKFEFDNDLQIINSYRNNGRILEGMLQNIYVSKIMTTYVLRNFTMEGDFSLSTGVVNAQIPTQSFKHFFQNTTQITHATMLPNGFEQEKMAMSGMPDFTYECSNYIYDSKINTFLTYGKADEGIAGILTAGTFNVIDATSAFPSTFSGTVPLFDGATFVVELKNTLLSLCSTAFSNGYYNVFNSIGISPIVRSLFISTQYTFTASGGNSGITGIVPSNRTLFDVLLEEVARIRDLAIDQNRNGNTNLTDDFSSFYGKPVMWYLLPINTSILRFECLNPLVSSYANYEHKVFASKMKKISQPAFNTYFNNTAIGMIQTFGGINISSLCTSNYHIQFPLVSEYTKNILRSIVPVDSHFNNTGSYKSTQTLEAGEKLPTNTLTDVTRKDGFNYNSEVKLKEPIAEEVKATDSLVEEAKAIDYITEESKETGKNNKKLKI